MEEARVLITSTASRFVGFVGAATAGVGGGVGIRVISSV